MPIVDHDKCRGCDWIDAADVEVCELLEQLDDAMFDALTGCEKSLAEANKLWRIAGVVLSEQLLEESREQYLRRAVEVVEHEPDDAGQPEKAIVALEVIELLSDE